MARSGEDRPIDGLPQVSHGQPGRAWYKARWPQVLDLSKPLAFTLLAKPNISITMIWLSMAGNPEGQCTVFFPNITTMSSKGQFEQPTGVCVWQGRWVLGGTRKHLLHSTDPPLSPALSICSTESSFSKQTCSKARDSLAFHPALVLSICYSRLNFIATRASLCSALHSSSSSWQVLAINFGPSIQTHFGHFSDAGPPPQGLPRPIICIVCENAARLRRNQGPSDF